MVGGSNWCAVWVSLRLPAMLEPPMDGRSGSIQWREVEQPSERGVGQEERHS